MPKYYFRKANQFIDFNENQVSNLYPNGNWTYRLLEEADLTRFNDIVYSQKNYDYVFNGTIPEVSVEQIRNQKLSQLEENYTNKINEGIVYQSKHFLLDDNTKWNIADWNQAIEKDRKLKSENELYTRNIITASITDASGSQKYVTDSEWDIFFMTFVGSYATIKPVKTAKENTIHTLSGSALDNYDVSL